MYIDNDADDKKLGAAAAIAQNVKVSVLIPEVEATWFNLVGFITADNSSPTGINNPMLVVGDRQLRLLFVPRSAGYSHLDDGKHVEDPLIDSIVATAGVGIGNVAPGISHSGFITLGVKERAA